MKPFLRSLEWSESREGDPGSAAQRAAGLSRGQGDSGGKPPKKEHLLAARDAHWDGEGSGIYRRGIKSEKTPREPKRDVA